MRLRRITVEGFRAFSSSLVLDLDTDVLILTGPNGQGKTSLLDAILWCLSGLMSRIGKEQQEIVSLFSKTSEATVELELTNAQGEELLVRRTSDGERQRLHVEINGSASSGQEAQLLLRDRFVPDHDLSAENLVLPALHTAMTKLVYLQQDLVRQFLEEEDEAGRFETICELLGVSRISVLQVELERQKASWTKATNVMQEEAGEFGSAVFRLDSQIDELSESDMQLATLADGWSDWWRSVLQFIEVEERPRMDSADAAIVLDEVLRKVISIRHRTNRRLGQLEAVQKKLLAMEELPSISAAEAETARESAEREVDSLEEDLRKAEAEVASRRFQVRGAYEKRQDMALFAQMALRHLGETCPVCQQAYDRDETEARLSRQAESSGEELQLPDTEFLERLSEQVEKHREAAVEAKRRAIGVLRIEQEWQLLRLELTDLGVDLPGERVVEGLVRRLEDLEAEIRREMETLLKLQSAGEDLSVKMAKVGEVARLDDLKKERNRLSFQKEGVDKEVRGREEAGKSAQSIIEALRLAGKELVSEELRRITPLAQRIYSAIEPHPAFRGLNLEATVFRGRGRVIASIEDSDRHVVATNPHRVLSSSQSNALALAIFLALNVGSRSLPLESVMLDDPLQSLDDINLLGLVDLLRRLREGRQLILSTHDPRFAGLLERKLRPTKGAPRTRIVHFDSWTRSGPTVSARDVEKQRELYIVA